MNSRLKELLMKAIDNELTSDEKNEVDDLIKNNEEFRNELESLRMVKSETDKLKLKEPTVEKWDEYWTNVYYKFERNFAWLLLSISAIILIAYAFYHIALDLLSADMPILIKFAISGGILAFIILFVSVARERFILRKSDKYKDIIR